MLRQQRQRQQQRAAAVGQVGGGGATDFRVVPLRRQQRKLRVARIVAAVAAWVYQMVACPPLHQRRGSQKRERQLALKQGQQKRLQPCQPRQQQ